MIKNRAKHSLRKRHTAITELYVIRAPTGHRVDANLSEHEALLISDNYVPQI